MIEMKMPKAVRRVTIVKPEGELVLYTRQGKKKRKDSKFLKPLRKAVRKSLRAQQVFNDEILERFDNSSRKKKDGWIRDSQKNVFKATRKGLKQMN